MAKGLICQIVKLEEIGLRLKLRTVFFTEIKIDQKSIKIQSHHYGSNVIKSFDCR